MSDICVVGSLTSGHDSCPPVRVVTGSSIVSVEELPVACIGDRCEPHSCQHHGTHTPIISTGSSLVSINGIPVARVHDKVAQGGCTADHHLVTGNSIVNIDK